MTDRYRLVVYRDSNEGELYDMDADPDQYANLWDRPEHRDPQYRLLLTLAQTQMRREGVPFPRTAFA